MVHGHHANKDIWDGNSDIGDIYILKFTCNQTIEVIHDMYLSLSVELKL